MDLTLGLGEITLVVIAAALSYFLVASLTARLFNWWADMYHENAGLVGLLWPITLPFGLFLLMAVFLVLFVEWGAGMHD